ncbi:MAG TPA: hypothetical protein VGM38_02530 [Pseudolysinimonas sp.]|jgi:type IV secretion system protein VirB4
MIRIRPGGGDVLKYADYEGHIRPNVIKRGDDSYVAMWRVEGLPFETLEDDLLYARRNDVNTLLINIASERLVIAAHEVRTLAEDNIIPDGEFVTEFGQSFHEALRERLTRGSAPLYSIEQFLSLTVRPHAPMGRTVAGFLRSAQLQEDESEEDAIKFLEDRAAMIAAGLKAYGLRRLGYRETHEGLFSEPGEAMVLIHSGRRTPVPVPDGPLGDALYVERTHWGPGRTITIDQADGRQRYASVFGFKVPGHPCRPWVFNHLKSSALEYSFSRHFHYMPLAKGEATTKKKIRRLEITKDPGLDQAAALQALRGRLMSRRSMMGNHHNVLTIFADSPEGLELAAPEAQAQLARNNASVVREDWVDLPAYWSHLPGNVHLWPRPMPVTSDNWASMASFNAYPIGPEKGRWGPPAIIFRSAGGTAVRHHWHRRDVGNFAWFGPTGGGKTAGVLALLAQSERYDPRPQIVYFDQYRGADIGLRALGGADNYHVYQDGLETGCAPLKALDPSLPRDMACLRYIARGLIGGQIDREEQRAIALALNMVMEMPVADRSWGEVRAMLGYERGGIGERLEPWCRGNEYGWALDCQEDRLSFASRVSGHDTTGIVSNEAVLGPIQGYLAYRTESILDGRRAIIIIDEFHHWIENPFWAKRAASLARTIRRRNGILGMLTQHPADIAKSSFGHTLMQQTPQQFFAPDPRAKPEDYVGGAQVTEIMFNKIKRGMKSGAGLHLRVVDGEAMVVQLPLSGLDAHLAVLSSRDTAVALAGEIRQQSGKEWVNEFMRRHEEAAV